MFVFAFSNLFLFNISGYIFLGQRYVLQIFSPSLWLTLNFHNSVINLGIIFVYVWRYRCMYYYYYYQAFAYLIVLLPFVKEISLSPFNCPSIFGENELIIYLWVYFCTLYSVLLSYISIFLPLPHCFDYNILISLEIMKSKIFHFTLLFQNCLGYTRSFAFYSNRILNHYKKILQRIFIGTVLNLRINLEKTNILTVIMGLLICEHSTTFTASFHSFRSF